MSLSDPANPKKQYQIHKSSDAMVSSTMVVSRLSHQYFPIPYLRAILPPPTRTINTHEHARLPSIFILCHQPLGIFFIWRSKIQGTKHLNYHLGNHLNGLSGCVLAYVKKFMDIVRGDAICKHPHRCQDFIIGARPHGAGMFLR
jgi:hypothetical protein